MPRVHFVKSARKDNPVAKKGEPYYWWKFRYGGKRYSKTYPRPSQMTQSEYYSQGYSLQERVEEMSLPMDESEAEDFISELEDVKSELEDMQNEIEDKKINLEEAFPNGCPTLELLEERYDTLQSLIDELDGAISDAQAIEWDEDAGDDKRAECCADFENALDSIGWEFG